METSAADLKALVDLLNPNQSRGEAIADSESDEEKDAKANTYQPISPGNIGTTQTKDSKKSVYTKVDEQQTCDEMYDPETDEYLPQNECSASDWKKTPEWDVTYKQNVSTADVFLNMTGKGPATFSCEDMIITVRLPNEKRPNLDLKVKKDSLILNSPVYFLKIDLPHTIDPQRSSSKWDSDTDTLICTLRMDREYDFVNF